MDNQAYLDQIAASNRPLKSSKLSNFLASNVFKLVAIGVGILVLIIVAANIVGGAKEKRIQEVVDFKAHLENLTESIEEYQGLVKSSSLRSQSASLSTIIGTITTATSDYIDKTYPNEKIEPSKKETSRAEERDSELFDAKINGLLDRTYARKLVYEISVIMATESKLIKSAKDNSFKEELRDSMNSLSVIQESIENLSL